MEELIIGLKQEVVFRISEMPVSNALFTSFITSALLVIFALFARKSLGGIFGTSFGQRSAEVIFSPLWKLTNQILGRTDIARQAFPLIATFFLFIIFANWLEILPGFLGSFYVLTEEGHRVPLFRSPSTDLNTTFALALISVGFTQIVAIRHLGLLKFLLKIIDVRKPIEAFLGILELISEASKVFSFAFRLFGNMFAGGVLLLVTGFLVPYVIPLPFMLLEIFVGFVQALIFSLLTLMFLKAALSRH